MTNSSARLPLVDPDQGHTPITSQGAIVRINSELGVHNSISGFMRAAERRLITASDELVATVGIKAIKLARKEGASVVDVSHVNKAYAAVNGPGWDGVWLAFFGVFAGLAGNFVITALTSNPDRHTFWWTLTVISVVLAALTFAGWVVVRNRAISL